MSKSGKDREQDWTQNEPKMNQADSANEGGQK